MRIIFIEIDFSSSGIVNISGGSQLEYKAKDQVIYRLVSPNHREVESIAHKSANIEELSTKYPNDSFVIVNKSSKSVRIFRDWPGNIPLFFSFDEPNHKLLISNNISHLSQKVTNASISPRGVKLFLNNRKHYHTQTIYSEIEVLHGGFSISIEEGKSSYEITHWYKPYKKVSIRDYDAARSLYTSALSEVLLKQLDKNRPIALMFSGGSDSVALLDKIIELGFKDIHLFTICIEGNNIQIDYASEKAAHYGLVANAISVNKHDVLSSWKTLYEMCYHYLSDLRIDGIFSPSVKVYQELRKHFSGAAVSIVWGSQYALISPMMNTGGYFKLMVLNLLSKSVKIFPALKLLMEKTMFKYFLRRAQVLNLEFVSDKYYHAYRELYLECFHSMQSPEEMMDLYLSTNYNSCKHWWMDWRGKVQDKFYPEAVNIYPFHDRQFQEKSMLIPMKIRVGGVKNFFRMPKEYKNFFYSILPKSIPVESVRRGNYKALPEYYSLFKNEDFYTNLRSFLNDEKNAKIVSMIQKEIKFTIPDTYEAFRKLDYLEVERLSGVMYIITRVNTDNVSI